MSREWTIVHNLFELHFPLVKRAGVRQRKSSVRRRPWMERSTGHEIPEWLHFPNVFLNHLDCVFLQALFCSSLPHPTADKDYALYEVGTGCEVAELIPGIDLLSEAFRSNGRSVVAALRWIIEELARARYLIKVRTVARHMSRHISLRYLIHLTNRLIGWFSTEC